MLNSDYTTEKVIRYDRETRDFALYLGGELIGYARSYAEGEATLDGVLAERLRRAAPDDVFGPTLVQLVPELCAEIAEDAARRAQAARQGPVCDEAAEEAKHWQRAANAYAKAAQYWLDGWRPTPVASGGWVIRSQRNGQPPHLLRKDGDWACSCAAGPSDHWAKALAVALEAAQEALATLDTAEAADAGAGARWLWYAAAERSHPPPGIPAAMGTCADRAGTSCAAGHRTRRPCAARARGVRCRRACSIAGSPVRRV